MTTHRSFSEGCSASPNKRFFNLRFFRFNMKTGWPMLVLFVTVFVLSLAVPSVSFITDTAVRYDTLTYKQMVRESAVEFLYTIGAVNIVVSMFMGFAAGLCTMNYMNRKRAVNFYHSLPLRREALFLTNALRGFVYYFISFAAGLLLVFVAFWARLGHPGDYLRPIFMTLEYGVLFFFLLYAMSLFAASLTGTGFMRFIAAGYVVFLPVVLVELFIFAINLCGPTSTILDPDYYMSQGVMTTLMSPLRLFNLTGNAESGFTFTDAFNGDIVVVLLTALVLFGVAFLLYILRPSESASKPIIWRPAAFVFKYATMFIGATVFAMIFRGIFESIIWMAFGIAFGSFVTFMLTNGILHKSARAIFKGLKGFIIFMVVMAGITTVFYMDVFGIFSKIPDGSLVSRIELNLSYELNCDYSGDLAEKVTNMIGKMDTKYSSGDYVENSYVKPGYGVVIDDLDLYGGRGYDAVYIEAVLHTRVGIPYAVNFSTNCEEVEELAKFLYAKEDEARRIPDAKDVVGTHIDIYLMQDSVDGWSIDLANEDAERLTEMAGRLKDPFLINANSPVVGSIYLAERTDDDTDTDLDSIYTSYYSYGVNEKTFYITAADFELLNEFRKDDHFTSEDDVIRYFTEKLSGDMYIVDCDTGETVTVSDPDEIFEIAKSTYSYSVYNYDPIMCRKDHSYNIHVKIDMTQNDYEYITDITDITDSMTTMMLKFRKGAVPDFVTEYFAK